ncbi:MAG TPA: hypothetical protein VMI53_13945 [Opitutaceae bacterium]|nr:hypothetical protein [Opitutaceae bacterium]
MPPENLPAPGQRQRVMLRLLAILLLAGALLAAFVLKKLPAPVRAFIAFGDVVAAAALLLLARKNPLGR